MQPSDAPASFAARAPRWLRSQASAIILVIALAVFGLPLFAGLDRWDLENDEALYSYAVDRILETGEWLTPRILRGEAPFLEKPPLKMWIVAAGIAAGLPHDEFGLRFFDPAFTVAAFAYVFLIGRRLAGPICGAVALLVLHTNWPLIFEHGVRTNNMEAALLLTCCGGVYHFCRWVEASTMRERRTHASVVALLVAFGFLVKFVAALLLPVVLAAAVGWRPDARAHLRDRWRDWVGPAIAAVGLCAPWFIYEVWRYGPMVWETMLGSHVIQRFTATLVPSHLQPWHYYFSRTFATDPGSAFPLAVSVSGLLLLGWRAWRGRPWVARLVLVWWMLPYALLSAGTSKLFHYAYPYFPPVALAVGMLAAWWIDVARGWIARMPVAPQSASPARERRWTRAVLAIAIAVAALGAWSLVVGPVVISAFGVTILRSAGFLRPAAAAALLLWLARERRAAAWVLATAVLLAITPTAEYIPIRQHMMSARHPLRAIRTCVAADEALRRGTYIPDPDVIRHPHYYYFRTLGPWLEGPGDRTDQLLPRLFMQERQSLVLMAAGDRFVPPAIARPAPLVGVATIPDAVVWLPGPYARCAAAAVKAGGTVVAFDPPPAPAADASSAAR
jgi:4-amino-4-deoxy-L-arabinose transferase-like glycosyltransferase